MVPTVVPRFVTLVLSTVIDWPLALMALFCSFSAFLLPGFAGAAAGSAASGTASALVSPTMRKQRRMMTLSGSSPGRLSGRRGQSPSVRALAIARRCPQAEGTRRAGVRANFRLRLLTLTPRERLSKVSPATEPGLAAGSSSVVVQSAHSFCREIGL